MIDSTIDILSKTALDTLSKSNAELEHAQKIVEAVFSSKSPLDSLVSILVPIAMFAALFGIVYVIYQTRQKERLAMIEKGMSPNANEGKKSTSPVLKWGLLLAGVGIGLFVGNLLDQYTTLDSDVAYFGMTFLFGGGGLISYYLIQRKMKKD